MKPRDRAIAALERRTPDDIVPTMEIEFQLHQPLLNRSPILGLEFGRLQGRDREKAIEYNVDLYLEEADRLDYSAITIDPLYWEFGHGVGTRFFYPSLKDQVDVARALRRRSEGRYLVAVSMDSTYGIPLSENMERFVFRMFEDEEGLLREAYASLRQTLESAERLVDAGVDLIYSCSDYCFGQNPFFSRDLFEKYVYPFLKRQTEAFRRFGAYVVKHTDGNTIPIIDFLLDSTPHAIHSIDPMAGMDIVAFKKQYGDRVCVMGNVDASRLEQGPVEAIVESAEHALRGCKDGGGYIFSTCNTVFAKVPLENYLAMLEVRKRLGRYGKDGEG